MAQNPINPGYSPQKPGETPANPLSMGYYPGKKLPRKFRPSAGSRFDAGGFNVDGTAITSEYLDSVADTAYNTIRGPDRWLRKRMDDDLKQTLKINALPPEGVPVERLDDFDTGTLPGGGFISLSVDPRDWVGKDERTHKDKAPEMVKKTLKNWASGIVKFADYETKAREILWKDVVNGSYDSTKHTSFENAAYDKMLKTYAPEIDTSVDKNPFQLSGRGIFDKEIEKPTLNEVLFTQGRDVYQDAANKLVAFERNLNAESKRGQTYYEYQNSTLHAVSTELSQKATSEVAESFVKRQNLLKSWVNQGRKEKDVTESITHAFDHEFNERVFKEVKKGLEEYQKKVGETSKALENAGPALEKAYGAASLKEWKDAVDKHLEITTSPNFVDILKATTHEGSKENIGKVLGEIGTAAGSLKTSVGGGHHIGTTLYNGLERKYSDRLAMELVGKTDVHQLIIDNGLEANRAISLLNGQGILNGLGGAKEVFGKIADPKKGLAGVGEAYLWNAGIQKTMDLYISPVSPKTYIKQALYKTNNLGLVLGDDKELRAKGWDMDYMNAPKGLFANKFKIDIASPSGIKRVEVWGGEHLKAVGTLSALSKATVEIEGVKKQLFTDAHMKALLIDGKTFVAKGINEGVLEKLAIKRLPNGKWEFSMLDPVSGNKKIVNVISKEFEDLNLLANLDTAEGVKNRIADLLDMKELENIEKYREWAAVNVFQKYGLDINDTKIWNDLTNALNVNSSWINQRYIGIMQRIGHTINRIQNQIYKIPLIGYAAKQFNGAMIYINLLKTQVVDFVRTKIIGTLTKMGLKGVLATALQSFMTFSLPIIGNIFAFIVTEILDRIVRLLFKPVKQFLGLLKKMAAGELTAALEIFEKEQDKRVKFILFILTIILALYAIFSPIVELFIPNIWNIGGMVTMDPFSDLVPFSLSTFAPVDETRKFGSLPQSYDWDIVLDPTGQSLANQPSYGIGDTTYQGGGQCDACEENNSNLPGFKPYVTGERRAIVDRAHTIAADLKRGFWCFFNKSSLYPKYWSEELFQSDPCYQSYTPGNGDPNALFWCTYMVAATHKLNFGANAGVGGMWSNLESDNSRYTTASRDTAVDSLKTGDVIFFVNSANEFIHVALVYSVSPDGIHTIESNAYYVSNFIPTTNCGKYSCPLSDSYQIIFGYALLNKP